MESGTCGLQGTVHVSTIAGSSDKSEPCHGSMSDWNSEQCRAHSQLWLSLAGPCRSSSRHLRVDSSSVQRQGSLIKTMILTGRALRGVAKREAGGRAPSQSINQSNRIYSAPPTVDRGRST